MIDLHMCVCACVCGQRETEIERMRQRERKGHRPNNKNVYKLVSNIQSIFWPITFSVSFSSWNQTHHKHAVSASEQYLEYH